MIFFVPLHDRSTLTNQQHMKKFYFMAFSLAFVGGSAYSQSSPFMENVRSPKHATGLEAPVHPSQAPNAGTLNGGGERSIFWTEDFSGGFPAGWTNVDELTPIDTLKVLFEWSNNPQAVVVAALGHQHIAQFNSATASNGYLWANSDRGLLSAPSTDHLTQLTTNAINCSGQESVLLTFQSVIGVYDNNANEFAKVRVSTDMVTWTDYFPFPCLITTGGIQPPCNRFSANPQYIELDISAVAADQPEVYIQWYWQGGWEYYWAIDDIVLSEVPDYSRILLSTYMSHVGQGVQYARIPASQLTTDFYFGGTVRNTGSMPQTGLTLTAEVFDPNGVFAFGSTESWGTLLPNDTAFFEQMVTLPALVNGFYTVEFEVTSDQDDEEFNPDDDVASRVFMITDQEISLDGIGLFPAPSLSSSGTSSYLNPDTQDGLQLLTFYDLTVPTTIYGIEALITSGTAVGAEVIFAMHSADVVLGIDGGDVSQPIYTTDFIGVTQADVEAGRVVGLFDQPIDLAAGEYYAVVSLFSATGSNHIGVLNDQTVIQPWFASLTWFPITGNEGLGIAGNAFAIRPLLDPSVSINELEQVNVSIYPNPTNGLVNIMLSEAGAYDVEVFSLLGERVHTTRIVNNAVLDLSGNAQGVYMIRISNENASTVQRITLN
jgi:hypothetical protein